jgi:hypothetical protein
VQSPISSDPKVGLSSSSVPRDLLPDIQTEEDLQAIFEANSVSTDNTDTDTAISETEHSTDTETRALFRASLMSIFAISEKLSLESTGGK